MSALSRLARTPATAFEFANTLLTTDDAVLGATEREVVWTHRQTTLYRYRSTERAYPVPLLLVFALINRPAIFDLRPGHSLVEYLLSEGFDVFLLDWGYPDEEDADTGLDDYVCDELHWGIRETLRASGADELSLLGWCIGATLCAMYCGLEHEQASNPVRNLALLTMPVEARGSTYARWVGDAGVRRRPGGRAVARPARRSGRRRQQAAQAGDQLLDDLPAAVGRHRRGHSAARDLPADGQVGRRQPERSRGAPGRSGSG